jgi:hypothetical protein
MKLKLSTIELASARHRMGAETRDIALNSRQVGPLGEHVFAVQLREGLEIELKDVETNDGGLLSYKGYQVVLYIPDQGSRFTEVIRNGVVGKKYHVADCQTLNAMRSQNRFERYHVRNGLSSKFLVNGREYSGGPIEDGEAELAVCKNCLKKLNFGNYRHAPWSSRDQAVSEFSLSEFFSDYSSYFRTMPSRTDLGLEANDYTNDWRDISHAYRRSVAWQCEDCSVDLRSRRDLLHVHHKNFIKSDNSHDNLRSLCKDCHSKMPGHATMFVSKYERREIARLRREQAVYKPPVAISHASDDWDNCLNFADPAVKGLLHELKHHGYEVPEIGGDIKGSDGRIACSNIELVWHNSKEAVVLEDGRDRQALEEAGWTVFSPQELLDELGD